jgi:ADP-heptose:LPS heptosyltransferase
MSSISLTRFIPRPARRLEAAVHAAWLRGLVTLFARDGRRMLDWDVRPERVLFIRYDRVGDMVLCTGILRALARAYPGMLIDVLTTPANAAVLEHLPFVDQVILHERKRWRDYPALFARLSDRRYDAVIDGLVVRPSVNSYTTMLMLASRAQWRIGSAGRPHDEVYNVPVVPPADVHREHHVEHLARLTGPLGIGLTDADWRPTLVLSTAERESARARWAATSAYGLRIFVNISAGQACRRWPDAHFAILLRALRAKAPSARIVVAGLDQDFPSATALAESVGGIAIVPTLRELFALVAEADLVVTPDTAVTHIAAAFTRPTLALMRRRDEYQMWVPYRTPGVNVFGPTEASLADLSAETAVDAVDDALAIASSIRERSNRQAHLMSVVEMGAA